MKALLLVAALLLAGCYEDDSKNLPPCPRTAQWPDPCFGAKKADAGTR